MLQVWPLHGMHGNHESHLLKGAGEVYCGVLFNKWLISLKHGHGMIMIEEGRGCAASSSLRRCGPWPRTGGALAHAAAAAEAAGGQRRIDRCLSVCLGTAHRISHMRYSDSCEAAANTAAHMSGTCLSGTSGIWSRRQAPARCAVCVLGGCRSAGTHLWAEGEWQELAITGTVLQTLARQGRGRKAV